jgi:hypothetical protein
VKFQWTSVEQKPASLGLNEIVTMFLFRNEFFRTSAEVCHNSG